MDRSTRFLTDVGIPKVGLTSIHFGLSIYLSMSLIYILYGTVLHNLQVNFLNIQFSKCYIFKSCGGHLVKHWKIKKTYNRITYLLILQRTSRCKYHHQVFNFNLKFLRTVCIVSFL